MGIWLWWVRFVGGGFAVVGYWGEWEGKQSTAIVRVPAPYIYSRKRIYMLMATTDIVKKLVNDQSSLHARSADVIDVID